jgi:hypothetical protein
MSCLRVAACVLVSVLVFSSQAIADVVDFFGADSEGRAASVRFETSEVEGNNQLIVTLANTSGADVLDPKKVLTAVFFYSPQAATTNQVSPVSAILPTDSFLWDCAVNPATDVTPDDRSVGAEWAFGVTTVYPPETPNYGISSSGLGVFGPHQVFPGDPLNDDSDILDGVDYGITSPKDNFATTNGGISVPLIQDAVVFTLDGFLGLASEITRVRFQYGTGLDEPRIVVPGMPGPGPGVVPEPATLAIWSLLAGLGGVGAFLRRKRA